MTRSPIHRLLQVAAFLPFATTAIASHHGASGAQPAPATLQSIAEPSSLSSLEHDPETHQSIRLAGVLEITDSAVSANGVDFNELSGLAFDPGSGILYAITDRGWLHHLRPVFRDGRLVDLLHEASFQLRAKNGKALVPHWTDAEGLAIRLNHAGKTPTPPELWISFERIPRVIRFDPQGRPIGKVRLPKRLSEVANYATRNDALEAFARDDKHGWVTLAERPMKSDPAEHISLFSERHGRFDYPLAKIGNSAVTAIEPLASQTDNAQFLVIERRFINPFIPLQIRLRKLTIDTESHQLTVQNLALFDNAAEWNVDNFEGLTHVRDNRYLMVSDNNGRAMQRGLLVFFEVLEDR